MGAHKAREIQARMDRCLDIWKRGIHAGLMGGVLAEGRASKGRIKRREEEEEGFLAHSFHSTLLSGDIHQAVRQTADHEEMGFLLPGDVYTKTGRPVADVLQEKHTDMRVPPVENHTCAAFEEYEEVPYTVPLDLSEDNVMWV